MYGNNGRNMAAMEGVRQQWKEYGKVYGINGRCMVAVEGVLIAFLYSAILRSRADSLRSHVILHE